MRQVLILCTIAKGCHLDRTLSHFDQAYTSMVLDMASHSLRVAVQLGRYQPGECAATYLGGNGRLELGPQLAYFGLGCTCARFRHRKVSVVVPWVPAAPSTHQGRASIL